MMTPATFLIFLIVRLFLAKIAQKAQERCIRVCYDEAWGRLIVQSRGQLFVLTISIPIATLSKGMSMRQSQQT
jgi:hypothetical protein